MVDVYICSYSQFNTVMQANKWNDDNIDKEKDVAAISICLVDGRLDHWFKRDHDNVLNLNFDDVGSDVPGCISIEQAKSIVDFYEKHINVKRLFVHCNAGISRSAAVAECFVDFLRSHNITGVTLHKNYAFSPNPEVERKIHAEIEKRLTKNNCINNLMSDITNKKIVIDLDDTISITEHGNYAESVPNLQVVEKLKEYKSLGYDIVIHSSRNMRTYNNNIGEINVHTLPIVLDFLKKYDIPYDQIIMGKPWCGFGGFYVDDKAIRPSEFVNMSESEVKDMLSKETAFVRSGKE